MVLRWAVKSLLRARLRVLGSTLAIAAAFILVMTFKAVWEGESEQLVVYIERTGADVWVMQPHVSNMHMATSFISDANRDLIGEVEGVRDHGAVLYLNTFVRTADRQWFCYVVGVEEPDQLGGPWSVTEGTRTIHRGQSIIPEVLSKISGLGVGDTVQIADRSFEIVGLSAETFSATNPITFVHASDLADLLSLTGYDSYVLVQAEPGISPDALAARITQEVDDVEALPTAAFMENDRELAAQMGTEIIALLTLICSILAALLVAFSLYIHTTRIRRDLAVHKALGFPNRYIYLGVLVQSLLLTGLAFAIALGTTAALAALGPRLVPVLSLSVSLRSVAEIGIAGLVVAMLSTLAVARRVGRVDPLSVFHA